jgi:hypothetical protein
MTSLTGSIRLADLHSSAVALRHTANSSAAATAAESIADFAKAAVHAVPATPSVPGLETAARFAQALKYLGQPLRTAAEELEDERVNAWTHALGLALSMAGFVYLLARLSRQAVGCVSRAAEYTVRR